ncbi:MAG TPA: hypothetical protein VMH22_07520 [bacterium]|nr:hypothetical protein [bacterium]
MSLREKIADIVSAGTDVTGGRWNAADAILALPEIAEALKAQKVVEDDARPDVRGTEDEFYETGLVHVDGIRAAVISTPSVVCAGEGAVSLGEYALEARSIGGDTQGATDTDGAMRSVTGQSIGLMPGAGAGGGFDGWGRDGETQSSYRGRANRRRRARPSLK